MGALVGVVVGYALGMRSGATGLGDLKGAMLSIGSSGQVKDLLGQGMGLVGEVVKTGKGATEQLSALRARIAS